MTLFFFFFTQCPNFSGITSLYKKWIGWSMSKIFASHSHWHYCKSLYYIKGTYFYTHYFYMHCNALCVSWGFHIINIFWMFRILQWLHLCLHASGLLLACLFFPGAFPRFLLPYHHRRLNSVKSLAGMCIGCAYWTHMMQTEQEIALQNELHITSGGQNSTGYH